MFIKPALSFVALAAFASFGFVACSASTDEGSEDPTAEVQDQELRKSITACSVDADCVAVPRGGCCNNGWNAAVNSHHTRAYANASKCTLSPRPMCPMYIVHDTRVAQCDTGTSQCKMFAIPIQGSWGADAAILTIADGLGNIELGCGRASIDAFTFSDPKHFTATGTHTRGTGVQPPPGMEPQPQPATFTGHIVGTKLTLVMTVGSSSTSFTFTKDRQVNLIHCL